MRSTPELRPFASEASATSRRYCVDFSEEVLVSSLQTMFDMPTFSASSASFAALSCPTPPSMSKSFGRGVCDLHRFAIANRIPS